MADPAKLMGVRDASPPWIQDLTAFFSYGHVAVAIFIVISGFSLQLSLFNSGDGSLKQTFRFYRRRAQRILPTYYACLACSILIALYVTPILVARYGAPFSMYLPVNSKTVLTHLALIHNWSPAWMYKINGVLWSIGVESQLYILFPVLVWLIGRVGRIPALTAASLGAGVFLMAVPDALKLYPWYLPLFVSGMCAAHLAFRPHLRIGVLPKPALWLTGLAIVAGSWEAAHRATLPIVDAWFGIGAAALMYSLTVGPEALPARLLGLRPVAFVGAFSYSLYLMHHPVMQALYLLKPHGWGGQHAMAFQFLVSFPLVLLACWLFSLAFEKPFLPKSSSSRTAEKPSDELKPAIVADGFSPARKAVVFAPDEAPATLQ
jgi:peptidoglycan/LPS O-acetylase OafA/YrhL